MEPVFKSFWWWILITVKEIYGNCRKLRTHRIIYRFSIFWKKNTFIKFWTKKIHRFFFLNFYINAYLKPVLTDLIAGLFEKLKTVEFRNMWLFFIEIIIFYNLRKIQYLLFGSWWVNSNFCVSKEGINLKLPNDTNFFWAKYFLISMTLFNFCQTPTAN